MSLPVPIQRTWATLDLVTAAMMNANVRDAVKFLAAPPLFNGVSAAAQSIPNATFTDVTLDTNVIDTYTGHSTVTNTARYVAQVAGYYLLFGKASFSPNATGRRVAHLAFNGGSVGATETEGPNSGAAGNTSVMPAPYLQFMSVGDYVTFQVFQSSGGALLTSAGATFLQVMWVHS